MITESARLFKELADNAPVMIWRSGTDRLCDFFNKPWLEFTGRALEQELGNGWATGVHPDDYERHRATYLDAFEARREFSTDYRLRRHDGEYRWILDKGRPFYRPDGAFAGYFGSCIDVTDRKLGEEQLRQALRRQDEMLREKEALLGEIHHRVRNNLQVMLGLIGLGIRRASDPGCRMVLASLADRIQTIAIVQRHLHDSPNMSQIDLKGYLR